jgi:hypothetical protein
MIKLGEELNCYHYSNFAKKRECLKTKNRTLQNECFLNYIWKLDNKTQLR